MLSGDAAAVRDLEQRIAVGRPWLDKIQLSILRGTGQTGDPEEFSLFLDPPPKGLTFRPQSSM